MILTPLDWMMARRIPIYWIRIDSGSSRLNPDARGFNPMDQDSFLRARFHFEGAQIDSGGPKSFPAPMDWILVARHQFFGGDLYFYRRRFPTTRNPFPKTGIIARWPGNRPRGCLRPLRLTGLRLAEARP